MSMNIGGGRRRKFWWVMSILYSVLKMLTNQCRAFISRYKWLPSIVILELADLDVMLPFRVLPLRNCQRPAEF